jgi:hypothetical protein
VLPGRPMAAYLVISIRKISYTMVCGDLGAYLRGPWDRANFAQQYFPKPIWCPNPALTIEAGKGNVGKT